MHHYVWGWVPQMGTLNTHIMHYLNSFFICGLYFLIHASDDSDSSFRRNRARLIQFGTVVTLSGAFVDFIRFIGTRLLPGVDNLYPLGIPANMVLALMLATSIVRYRLFDVTTAV